MNAEWAKKKREKDELPVGRGGVAGTRVHLLGAPIPILPTTTPTDQNFYIAYTLKYNAQWAKTNTKNE